MRTATLVLILLVLVSCGGGSGSNTQVTPIITPPAHENPQPTMTMEEARTLLNNRLVGLTWSGTITRLSDEESVPMTFYIERVPARFFYSYNAWHFGRLGSEYNEEWVGLSVDEAGKISFEIVGLDETESEMMLVGILSDNQLTGSIYSVIKIPYQDYVGYLRTKYCCGEVIGSFSLTR